MIFPVFAHQLPLGITRSRCTRTASKEICLPILPSLEPVRHIFQNRGLLRSCSFRIRHFHVASLQEEKF